ncbi:MAG: hypothetical protein ACE5FI_13325, partial [Anaerolineales bacterium]
MRPNLRRTLAPISVVLYSLIPLSPLFERRMTCSDDGIFHIYKAVGLEAVVQLGHWLPRWSPHMAHGYGYPLYNFYAPLASYLMIGWHALGLIYPVALHLTLGLSIVLAGLAMFALVRDWWGEAAGLGAAVVYLTAPYLGFDVLYRGALAETVAWVFPPLLLWTLDRALQRGCWRWGAAAALAFAALIYTHNTTALVVAPLAGGYVLLLAWQRREWPDTLRGGAILAAGLALAAQFWLPALAEHDLVQTERLLAPPIFTYNTNFITGSDLLALPAATNTALINPSPPKALGLVTALLALIGLAAAVTDSAGRSRKVFFGGALLFYGFMTLAPSQPLWDALPLIQFVQFPWRLLMPAALCAAILAGAAIEFGFRFLEQLLVTNSQLPITGSPKLAIGNWHLVTAVAIVIIAANLSWWYPRYCSDFMEQNVASMLDYEYATFTVGTSAKAEFLPDTAAIIPADDTLADALRAGAEPVRLAGLPEGATLETLQDDPLDFRARIDAPLDFTAEYRQFYYPGWSVTIDGETAPVRVAAETGLIRFDIPAGGHEMRVRFGSTPVRAAAAALSVLGLVAVGFAVVTADRRRPTTGISEQSTMGSKPSAVSDRWSVVVLAPLALLILKTTLIDTTNNPLHRTE